MFKPTTRLPIFGRAARVASRGFVWDDEMVFGARTCFAELRTILHHPKDKQFGTPYAIAVHRCLPEARKKLLNRVTSQSCGNCDGYTDGKEVRRARSLVANTIWSRENQFFPAHRSGSQHNSSNIELCGIIVVLQRIWHDEFLLYIVPGRCLVLSFSLDWLTHDSVARTNRMVFESNLHLWKLAHSSSCSPASTRFGEGTIAYDRTLALSSLIC